MAGSSTNVHHPLFARLYDRLSAKAEDAGQTEHRQEMLEGLAGRVLEVGAGNGLNFVHYPDTVTEVVAVEPEPFLRARAEEAANLTTVPIRVVSDDGSCGSGRKSPEPIFGRCDGTDSRDGCDMLGGGL